MTISHHLDPEQMIRRDNMIRRGLDPDFHYTSSRFATVAALARNLPFFVNTFGINNVGFLLLTFRRPIGVKEARRSFTNVWRRFLPEVFCHWICVIEFAKNGRPHFHLVVQCRSDIRSEFQFFDYRRYLLENEIAGANGRPLSIEARRQRRNAIPCNQNLRKCWDYLDNDLTDFGFGPVYDFFPVETDAVTLRKYLSKDFLSGLPHQTKNDKGARLVTYSRGCPRAVPPGWRPPSPWFDERLNALLRCFDMRNRNELKERLAVRYWAYSVLCLIKELNGDLPLDWPSWPTTALAYTVITQIVEKPYFRQNLGCLLPDLNRVINADPTFIPAGKSFSMEVVGLC